MKLLLDSFWRAAAYCVHPRVIALTILPLVISAGVAWGLSWFYWTPAVDAVRAAIENMELVGSMLNWIEGLAGTSFRTALAPAILIALAVPVIVLLSLVLVAVLMSPAIASLVAERRFSALERKHGAGFFSSVVWSLSCTLVALVLLVLSIPLWLIPPLILLLPPLIWGWLTTRVMSFDALADHASREERRTIMREHRWPLLGMGIITGYLGAAPSMIWAIGALTLVLAPVLIVVSIWLYTLVFAFAALWFTHYCLAALALLRRDAAGGAGRAPVSVDVVPLPSAERPSLPLPPEAPHRP